MRVLVPDARQQALDQWVADYTGTALTGEPVVSDAGFRRYFRYRFGDRSLIAMDAPPEHEDCRPFIAIAKQLANAGINVPHILAQQTEQGFLLLSDLGEQTFLQALNEDNADHLMHTAMTTLVALQQTDTTGLPHYDATLLHAELELFCQWYLQQHLGITVSGALRKLLDQLFTQLIEQILTQSKVFVHRDYILRNLMLGNPPGVIDFQDAVYGPISYDPLCLVEDAFISWPRQRADSWLRNYWQQAQVANLPVPTDFALFRRDCDIIGVQRHLKVIGIFARLYYRDGKLRYLQDVPRFFHYLHAACEHCTDLPLLTKLLAEIPTE